MLAGIVFAFVPVSSAQPQDWQSIGPSGGDVISMAASARDVVYLGTADGHIFASADVRRHWSLRGRVSSRQDAVVQKLLVNTQRENELLAAVWFQDVREGGGLYRSSDAGATWTLAGLSGEVVRALEQSSSAPEVFVVGTRGGVFRSTDAAQSWQRISPAGDPELRNVDSVAIDPGDPQIIYAGTYHLPWRTSDGGKTWIAVASGMIDDSDVMSLRVDSTSPQRIFASACSGIYRSENGATAWTKLQGIPYSSRRTQAIVQDPADPRTLFAATTEGLWLTHDGGESWARATPRDWVVNDLVLIPAPPDGAERSPENSSSQILLGTEAQGVLLSLDGGITFTPYNDGFSHRVTAALLSDPRDPLHLLAWMPGSPDPLIESHDGSARWEPLPSQGKPEEISRVFASDSGWWAAGPNGALANYDAKSHQWVPFRFAVSALRAARRASAGPSRSGATSRRTATPRPSPSRQTPVALPSAGSDVFGVRTIGARVFVATAQALWAGMLGEKILRPVTEMPRSEPGPAPQGSPLWLAAGGKLWQSEDDGKSWHAQSIAITAEGNQLEPPPQVRPELGPELRPAVRPTVDWIQQLPLSPLPVAATTTTLAGTTGGLYRQTGNDNWRLVQNGLPASEPVSYFFGEKLCLIATRAGGLYMSRDAAHTWERLDGGSVAGQFTGAVVTQDGHIVAASLTEGLLRH